MPRLSLAAALMVAVFCCPAHGQDRRGEEATTSPEYHGTMANAPIPPKYHVRNEGGSNGAGLCVISSLIQDGAYQSIGDLPTLKESALWKAAKKAKGGYYPGKLEALLKAVMPDAKWFSWEGKTPELVKQYNAAGYPVATTMNTGAQYGYAPIHHMISVAHLDDQWACVVDNNDPGKYHWMPAAEYARRFPDGGNGWGFVWLPPEQAAAGFGLWAAVILLAAVAIKRRRERRRWALSF